MLVVFGAFSEDASKGDYVHLTALGLELQDQDKADAVPDCSFVSDTSTHKDGDSFQSVWSPCEEDRFRLDLMRPGFRVGLIDADLLDNGTRHPNLALMKISGYAKSRGCEVELLEGYGDTERFDVVFVSKVFSFTDSPSDLVKRSNVVAGGTGFFEDGGFSLPLIIEHHKPDYSLYDAYVERKIAGGGRSRSWFADYLDYSIGFATRGCFRKCSFCVNKKYERAFAHSPISEFLEESRPYIYLWDDNFLAYSGWERILDELELAGKPFQFRQGLDIRLLTEKKAHRLSRARYRGDFIFAFDHIEEREIIEKKLRLWRRFTARGTRLYVLCAYESQDEHDIASVFERVKVLMSYGCLPYVMRYESYKTSPWRSLYVSIARWCNQPQFFKKKSFRDFCETNQLYHKTEGTNCSAYQAMLDFERAFPEIAARYFDLRFEEENMLYRHGRPFLSVPSKEVAKMQLRAWKRFGGESDSGAILRDYYAKHLDIVFLEECMEDVAEAFAGRLFEVLRKSSVEDACFAMMDSEADELIVAENIPQYSSLDDAAKMAKILTDVGDFLSYEDAGIMLAGGERKAEFAHKKYGENHGKLAALLDLANIGQRDGVKGFSETLFSERFALIEEPERREMLAKLALRIPIIQALIKAANEGEVSASDHMSSLSDTTLNRRLPNVMGLVALVEESLPRQSSMRSVLKNIKR